MQLRMNRAKSLLLASPLSIEQISAAVGFNDSAILSRCLKNMGGALLCSSVRGINLSRPFETHILPRFWMYNAG